MRMAMKTQTSFWILLHPWPVYGTTASCCGCDCDDDDDDNDPSPEGCGGVEKS